MPHIGRAHAMDCVSYPYFEAEQRLDHPEWRVIVTWSHTLRQRIDGLEFRSKDAAEKWIRHRSRMWFEIENLHIDAHRLRNQLTQEKRRQSQFSKRLAKA